VKGRKRGFLVDTLGLLRSTVVASAALSEAEMARRLLQRAKEKLTRVLVVFVDGGFEHRIETWTLQECGWHVEVVKRDAAKTGWQLLPKRWIVERTIAWVGRCRSLSKEYDYLPETSESRIYLAMIGLMLRRLAP
jgi:putative transposase